MGKPRNPSVCMRHINPYKTLIGLCIGTHPIACISLCLVVVVVVVVMVVAVVAVVVYNATQGPMDLPVHDTHQPQQTEEREGERKRERGRERERESVCVREALVG